MHVQQKRSSWPADVLLPAAQVLAEGSWLAVVYAAIRAISGEPIWLGPVEIALMVWAGLAWGRRSRWTGAGAEAIGLPLLALGAGALGWLIDPEVRGLLVSGRPLDALGTHPAGWIAAIGFWRGHAHRLREDDDAVQDQLLRWVVPGLAVPWIVGHLAASGAMEAEFTAAAFVGTVLFIGSAFTAMGLARLEAVRSATGSDWRSNRSWLVLVVGVALALTVVAIPAAAFLGVPAHSLLVALLGPVQTILIILVILATPVLLVAASLAELIQPLLPEGFGLGQIDLPSMAIDQRRTISGAPTLLFFVIVISLVVIEAIILAAMIYLRWQERRRMQALVSDPFEERAVVIPDDADELPSARAPRRRRRGSGRGPVGAYLAALDELERDGRWSREPAETPAAHAARARAAGLSDPSLGRLAAAYQLVRYGSLRLGQPEEARATGRLRRLRSWLRRAEQPGSP